MTKCAACNERLLKLWISVRLQDLCVHHAGLISSVLMSNEFKEKLHFCGGICLGLFVNKCASWQMEERFKDKQPAIVLDSAE